MTPIVFLSAAAMAFATSAIAGSDDVTVDGPWARASIGMDRPGAAYMILRNTGDTPVTLTGATTDLARMPEIHETNSDGGTATMAPAGDIRIPAGGEVALEPGGYHAMLMGLTRPMAEGETFTLTLQFADGGTVAVDVPIRGIGARGPDG